MVASHASPFDIKLANTGGEDHDFFSRIQSQGARFLWCDEAVVYGFVPFERQRPQWILERRLPWLRKLLAEPFVVSEP